MTKILFIMAKICNTIFWIKHDPQAPLRNFTENSFVLVMQGFPYQRVDLPKRRFRKCLKEKEIFRTISSFIVEKSFIIETWQRIWCNQEPLVWSQRWITSLCCSNHRILFSTCHIGYLSELQNVFVWFQLLFVLVCTYWTKLQMH